MLWVTYSRPARWTSYDNAADYAAAPTDNASHRWASRDGCHRPRAGSPDRATPTGQPVTGKPYGPSPPPAAPDHLGTLIEQIVEAVQTGNDAEVRRLLARLADDVAHTQALLVLRQRLNDDLPP